MGEVVRSNPLKLEWGSEAMVMGRVGAYEYLDSLVPGALVPSQSHSPQHLPPALAHPLVTLRCPLSSHVILPLLATAQGIAWVQEGSQGPASGGGGTVENGTQESWPPSANC